MKRNRFLFFGLILVLFSGLASMTPTQAWANGGGRPRSPPPMSYG